MTASARKTSDAGVRISSGLTLYDEKFIGGRLVSRYISACGQITPEMHLPDGLFESDEPTFTLTVAGEAIDGNWRLARVEADGNAARVVMTHAKYPVEVAVSSVADGTGWITRTLTITNIGDAALPLDEVAPFGGVAFRHVFDNGILSYSPSECGADEDSIYEIGYSAHRAWGQEGDFVMHPLRGEGVAYDSGFHGRSGWSRPAYVLGDRLNGHLLAVEFAYSGNWRMRVRPDKTPNGVRVRHAVSLCAPQGEAARVLAPSERVTTPPVHFTYTALGMERLIQSRHAFVRGSVMPSDDPIGAALIEANHRGYLCDRESEEGIKRDMDIAARAGAELYVIDAGWFGRSPNRWFDNAGDWYPGAWLPNGLDPLIERAKKLGMKFGLWMEIEAAGKNSALREEHPEFLLTRRGEPVAEGRALDFANPEVVLYIEERIADVLTRYPIDMFRVDHNHHLLKGGTREAGGYTENTLWRYYDNLYALYRRLRARFPSVSFQNCAAGGGRLDLGALSCFHHTEISDWARPPRDIKIFTGILAQLPPEKLLRICGTEVSEPVQSSDMLASLHSVMQGRMILRGIAPSLEEVNPELMTIIRRATDFYKAEIRPILRGDCAVFLHAPLKGVLEAWDWVANEYALPDQSAAFAVVQKLSTARETDFVLRFSGIDPGSRYAVYFDRKNARCELPGTALCRDGLTLSMPRCLETELILVKKIG